MTAIKIGDAIAIKVGSTNVLKVMYGGRQVWPMAYECTLAPESWTFGGQYLITAIPAAGGYASPTRWVFTIKDPVTHQAVHTIYLNSLLTAPTIEEYINGQWVAAQHFSFTDGRWLADDRGTNGYGSSGSDAPQSAPARQSRMIASYTTTYNNVQCSATYTGSMVQNGNNAVAGTSYYSNLTASIPYYDSSHQAPASQTITTLTATADLVTPYTFIDAVTGATNPATYDKIQANAALTDDFTFDGPSWVTIGTATSQGAQVTIDSRGTDFDVLYRYDRIRATLNGTADYDDVYVYQAANIYTDEVKQYTGASTIISPDPIPATDRSFTVFGYLDYQYKHEYSSGAWDPDWLTDYESATAVIDSVTMDGISYYDFSGNVVSIDENQGLTDIEYETVSHITDPAGRTWSNLTSSATQEGISQQITFGTPSITDFYYPETDGYNIPASGGAVNPVVVFEIEYSINGVHDNSMVLSGSVDDGENHGTLDDGVATCDYDIYYRVGGQSSSDGEVSANSRGTNPDPDGTTTIQLATNCYAYVRMDGKNSSNSSSETVTQQANHEEGTEDIPVSYVLDDLTFSWTSGNNEAVSAGETGTLSYSCTEYYTVDTIYTSRERAHGQTLYDRSYTPEFEVASGYSSWPIINGDIVTAPKRLGTETSDRSSRINAICSENVYGYVDISQAGTYVWYTLEPAALSPSSIAFTAAGNSSGITVSFSGYKNFDNGDEKELVSNSPSTTLYYDGDVADRIYNDGTGGRRIKAYNLGTTPYDAVETYYEYEWTIHEGARCQIPVTQGANVPETFGTISFPIPSASVSPSGSTIQLSPTCPFDWSSGSHDTASWDAFNFSWNSQPNYGYRDYSFDSDSNGAYAVYGSLGTNARIEYTSRVTATLIADSSKSATVPITELLNEVVDHYLTVQWDVRGEPIDGAGGISRLFVDNAYYYDVYTSGGEDPHAVQSETILSDVTVSGTGFSYSYSPGAEYGDVTATQNPSTVDSRYCTVTATYRGETDDSLTLEQYAYVVVIVTQAYTMQGWNSQPTFTINPYTLDTYILDCRNAEFRVLYASIATGAAGRDFNVRIDTYGDGTVALGSGTYYISDTYSVPSSSGNQDIEMDDYFNFDTSEVQEYSFIRCVFSLEGAPGENLTMSGGSLTIDFNV